MDYKLNKEINYYHLTARMLGHLGLVSIFLSVLGRLVNTQNRQKSDHLWYDTFQLQIPSPILIILVLYSANSRICNVIIEETQQLNCQIIN